MGPIREFIQNVSKILSAYRDFFIILAGVFSVVTITQSKKWESRGFVSYIEIEQLPRLYIMDSTRLKVEIFYLKSSGERKIPKTIPIRFHQFNFHIPTYRWYLTKSDIQAQLPDLSITRIQPDTIWFSPWYSEVRYLPVKVQLEVPEPFELIQVTIQPDSVPILFRGNNSLQQQFINLGIVKTSRDKRFQEFVFKTNQYIPHGTATNVQKIIVRAEIGQWKPEFVTLEHRVSNRLYKALIYMEIPVEDSVVNIKRCIRIHAMSEPPRFTANVLNSENCLRIRRVKIVTVHEND